MYVFQAIRTCGFWKEHNTLFNLKRLAKIDSFDTILYMHVAVLLVFARISYGPGEGRMRPNVVSLSTKRHPLDVIENHLCFAQCHKPQAIKCPKHELKPIASSC